MACCETMRVQLESDCRHHPDPWDCPDAVVTQGRDKPVFPIRDGGRSYLTMDYCPWCGVKL